MKYFYTDGCCLNNPGGVGASSFVEFQENTCITKKGIRLNNCTNNQAEYIGLILALTYINNNAKYFNENITIFSDSQLMVNQVNGIYDCKSENLLPLYNFVNGLLESNKNVSVQWIPREQNKVADEYANYILENK